MNKSIVVLTCLVIAAGCASAPRTPASRATLQQHQWSDAEWYADALDAAFESYEGEVEAALTCTYGSADEAEMAILTFGQRRFDVRLDRSLAERGLSRAGLAIYATQHPQFAAYAEATYPPRMQRVSARLRQISRRVRVHAPEPFELASSTDALAAR